MIELKPEQHNEIKAWLYNKGVQKCPGCGHTDFYKGYQGPMEMQYTDNINLNSIQITCPNCTCVMMFCLPSILKEMSWEKQLDSDT